MKHKHSKLIAQWNEDNSIEFEFAYGTGVDFVWVDCDIVHAINNPSSQIRVKDKKPVKVKRVAVYSSEMDYMLAQTFSDIGTARATYPECGNQFINIEVEVK